MFPQDLLPGTLILLKVQTLAAGSVLQARLGPGIITDLVPVPRQPSRMPERESGQNGA
jgi:hypothetical protein